MKHVEIKNADEIMILKAGEQVSASDEIGFIFSVLIDSSKQKHPVPDTKSMIEEEETKKRK
jgi:hypothetical protein